MDLFKTICLLIGFLLVMLGMIVTYDARKIAKKRFSFNDQNEGAKGLKIGGFAIAFVGILIIYFSL